jgi:dolichyl-phosphate-mannose-protein mannosyltransferase
VPFFVPSTWRSPRSAASVLLAIVITAYGGILRLNALSSQYGTVERPGWARWFTQDVAPIGRHLEPKAYNWPRVATPYVGGDPINYLRYAREMRSFYQAHLREPIFLVSIRAFLWLLHGQDIAISFASATASTLAIFATFLLGATAFSPTVGLLAALGLAVDYDTVHWSADGWRDDTFMLAVVLTTWALVRLRQRPTAERAVAAGALGAIAGLTRITSISFLVPALVCVAAGPRAHWRRRAAVAALALGCTAVLVAPYLVNCARVFGDPLLAINAHTVYYRAHEGLPYEKPESGLRYIAAKIERYPIREADTAIAGVFVVPLTNKWFGFDLWVPHLTAVLETLAVAGLLLFLASADGRLLLVVAFSSVVPYAFTWIVPGGDQWRFTMHVYPIFLIAAMYAGERTVLALAALRKPARIREAWKPRLVAGGAAVIVALGTAVAAYARLPYAVEREALLLGEPATIDAGDRDAVFFTTGWSPARQDGNVTARVVVGDRAKIEFPLPERRAYRLTLRVDPVTAGNPALFTIVVNGRVLGRFALQVDPARVGSYSVDVPEEVVRPGHAVLQVIANGTVRAADAGPRYAWLAPDTHISLRVWYLRIQPLSATSQ